MAKPLPSPPRTSPESKPAKQASAAQQSRLAAATAAEIQAAATQHANKRQNSQTVGLTAKEAKAGLTTKALLAAARGVEGPKLRQPNEIKNIISSGRTGSGGRNNGNSGRNTGSQSQLPGFLPGAGNFPQGPANPHGNPPPPSNPQPQPTVIPSSTTTSEVSSAAAAAIPRQSLIPGRDVINFQTTPTSPEAMQQILFEEIAGYELVNMARRDTIEGQSDVYTVISNLSSIRREYNPAQLISLQKPNFTGFETYQVDLNNYVPGDGYLQERDLTSFYYIASNGDLVIELDNLQEDDEIEVQMANNGKIT